jgi:glucose-1-phosphate adenylyltransferase
MLAVIMAGGMGSRLQPLTSVRAKPAVPFGGIYRIIDFTLSNCINSEVRQVWVLTQYKSQSLSNHLKFGWNFLSPRLDQFIGEIPAQMQQGSTWYRGTADAIRQNMHFFDRARARQLLVLAGDHVYKMDYRLLQRFHEDRRACLTIAAVRVPAARAAGNYGVIEVDAEFRVVGFEEKPAVPRTIPGTNECLASMGIYLFNYDALERCLAAHDDFGKEAIPAAIAQGEPVYAWDFARLNLIGEYEYQPRAGYRARAWVERACDADYWRDVGTLEEFWRANLDLVAVTPAFNLYGENWPIFNFPMFFPPVKFVHDAPYRTGAARGSILCNGVLVSGGTIVDSVVGPGVYVNSWAQIETSVVFGGSITGGKVSETTIGRSCRVRNAIIDKGVHLGEGVIIGHDREHDEARGLTVQAIHGGRDHVVVVPRGCVLDR